MQAHRLKDWQRSKINRYKKIEIQRKTCSKLSTKLSKYFKKIKIQDLDVVITNEERENKFCRENRESMFRIYRGEEKKQWNVVRVGGDKRGIQIKEKKKWKQRKKKKI